ncbi:MAG TPA: glycoside hydrolase family 127 protein [Saprospiraceae bacterium]|nr:glycoside hydrolase family 127 protein [Saprospiraceae bacterium]HPI05650.1 glycoside hydrolase family 127 protein [Saprospiraceae bacterium]
MKHLKILLGVALFLFTGQFISAQNYPIVPIPFQKVQLEDRFWAPRLEVVRKVTIPVTFQKNEETGRLKNFDIAAGHTSGNVCTQFPFDDSDVYKSIEGAAISLTNHRDAKLEARVDSLIRLIAAAQEPDGYVYTWRTITERLKKSGATDTQPVVKGAFLDWLDGPRWANEDKLSHELYCAGHLYEAAVAWYTATGKRNLLDIALKNAALIDRDFGPGKLAKAPGHQEIEIGLVKLFQTTGEKRWLNLAKFFIETRGYGEPYSQNHQKVKEQRVAVGHAVRLAYMFMAVADIAAYTGTHEYDAAMKSVWEDIVGSQMYITGGVGATGSNEGFGGAYDLPNYSAYCETCSSIAFVLWTQRMFQLTGDSRYIDVLELTLYNALNAGLSLSGDAFFYPNPLESRKNVERSAWFGCACCPPNLTRFFSGLPGMLYARKSNDLYVNLFAASSTSFENLNSKGQKVKVNVRQETDFPWNGLVKIHVDPAKPNTFSLKVRIPGWAKGDAVPLDLYRFHAFSENPVSLRVNGKVFPAKFEDGYAIIERKWNAKDVVELDLPMAAQRVQANAKVEADAGRLALKRGPLVYCLEGKDQADEHVLNMLVPDSLPVNSKFETTLFGGVQTLGLTGFLVKKKTAPHTADLEKMALKAIPYYAWANRGRDNMLVWLPHDLRVVPEITHPTLATLSTAAASEGCNGDLKNVADQVAPKSSSDEESSLVHWWPHFGITDWLQYNFSKPEQVGTARVFWFDDEVRKGGCRVPKSWRILYLENGEWKPVYAAEGFKISRDAWNTVQFEPVKTTAIRLEMQWQDGVSGGVHELEIF